MQKQTIKTLGMEVSTMVPASVEEFNQNAMPGWTPSAPTNPCLTEATNNVLYRSWLAQFRPTFLHGNSDLKVSASVAMALFPESEYLMKVTVDGEGNIPLPGLDDILGIERKTKKNEKGEVEEWAETEGVFATRIQAPKYQDWGNVVANLIPFDASAKVKVPVAPKKTTKAYLVAADQILAQPDKAGAVCAALGKILGITVELNRESLGKAISLNEARKRAEAQAKLAAEYTALIN